MEILVPQRFTIFSRLNSNLVGPDKHRSQLPYRDEPLRERPSPNRRASRNDNYKCDHAGAREFGCEDYEGRRGTAPSGRPCAAKQNEKSREQDRATAKPLHLCRPRRRSDLCFHGRSFRCRELPRVNG